MPRALLLLLLVAACSRQVRATDPDHDGVAHDRCPADAEDVDGFEDTDGCPDLDDDADRIADIDDHCAREPEDRDGYRDTDGCPDPDNDLDRILDAADACPDDFELYNGFADDDGCPDPIAIDYDSFTDNLFIPTPVLFAPNAATLGDPDFLARFAHWLVSEPKAELVGVIGHIEPGEPAQLGLARARAVADALVRAGLPTTRLAVHDAGLTPAHEWARVKRPPGSDRSVHFRFFRIAGKTIYRWSGSLDARVE